MTDSTHLDNFQRRWGFRWWKIGNVCPYKILVTQSLKFNYWSVEVNKKGHIYRNVTIVSSRMSIIVQFYQGRQNYLMWQFDHLRWLPIVFVEVLKYSNVVDAQIVKKTTKLSPEISLLAKWNLQLPWQILCSSKRPNHAFRFWHCVLWII